MQYRVDEEGVHNLKTMSSAICVATESMINNTMSMQRLLDEYEDTLGSHKAQLEEALEEILEVLKGSTVPVQALALILNEIAEDFEEEIGRNRYGAGRGK